LLSQHVPDPAYSLISLVKTEGNKEKLKPARRHNPETENMNLYGGKNFKIQEIRLLRISPIFTVY
jgi:hypothetical protein